MWWSMSTTVVFPLVPVTAATRASFTEQFEAEPDFRDDRDALRPGCP